ncbi:MAG: hypothetical protein ACI9VM_000355 [Candidatus Azotimanducaceae bacterium]|jgi:hypothetical protein
MRQSTHKRTILGIVLGSVILSLFLIVSYAYTNDTICIVEKGTLSESLSVDRGEFIDLVSGTKYEALEALKNQFNPDTGFFTYNSHPNGEVSTTDNAIRQLLASRALAVHSVEIQDARAMHRQNLDTILTKLYKEEEDRAYVFAFEKSKLGANAMLLRTLVASPYYDEYEEQAEKLANGIVFLMNSDGSFRPWYIEPGYEYDADYLLTFYSGEALLALLEYNEMAENKVLMEKIVLSTDFYIDAYVTNIEKNYYPAYVPWHTQVLNLLHKKTGKEKYSDALFTLNDKLLEIQDRTEFIGRFYNSETPEYGSPHVSSDAVYTEGLAYALEIAQTVGDLARVQQYEEAIMLGYRNIKSLQHAPKWWNFFEDNKVSYGISGGFTTDSCSSWVRIDSIAHAIDGFEYIEAVFKP